MVFFNIDNSKRLTVEWLKKEWRRIALALHPDKGGNEANFKLALNEYEELLQSAHADFTAESDSPEAYGNDWTEFLSAISPAVRRAVAQIRPVVEAQGATMEVTGTWVWVSNTKPAMAGDMKSVGLKWASGKKLWFWNGEVWHGKRMGMTEIRDTFGSKKWSAVGEERKAIA
jgi:hypothetical protein